jgi:hypothetical protein
LSRGSSPSGYPAKPLVSYQINRQLSAWISSSTSDSRLRGARPKATVLAMQQFSAFPVTRSLEKTEFSTEQIAALRRALIG